MMGILDDIFGSDKKAYKAKPPGPVGQNLREVQSPISLSVRFLPLRLAAKKDNRIDMIVRITNESAEKQLISFEASVPRAEMMGFDSMVIAKHYEKKLGYLEPNASAEFAATVYGTTQTRPGNYPIDVAAYVHFGDYNKVMNFIKRRVSLRVV
jgi:hypothetical protein